MTELLRSIPADLLLLVAGICFFLSGWVAGYRRGHRVALLEQADWCERTAGELTEHVHSDPDAACRP